MYLKYLWYVIRHKWFVMLECFKVGLYWRGIMHDMSKLRPSEFFPYARYFYGDYGVKNKCPAKWADSNSIFHKTAHDFDFAWLLHQKRNEHHWQWWILSLDDGGKKILPMSCRAIDEMICDWKGAGRAITGAKDPSECKKWYLANRVNMRLHDDTRLIVEILLGVDE